MEITKIIRNLPKKFCEFQPWSTTTQSGVNVMAIKIYLFETNSQTGYLETSLSLLYFLIKGAKIDPL
jgi:hypothetical protein